MYIEHSELEKTIVCLSVALKEKDEELATQTSFAEYYKNQCKELQEKLINVQKELDDKNLLLEANNILIQEGENS